MMKVAIVGYGNLGRGVEKAVSLQNDMELVGIFTRRDPSSIQANHEVYALDDIAEHDIDVAILCGGSATDLQTQSPQIAKLFNIVDSFDTHANIPSHFAKLDEVAKENGHLAMISSGWDPGLFSIARLIGESVLPNGSTTTFWGKGVSQGHSDAIRRIEGVENAVQYTIPREEAVLAVQEGRGEGLTTRDKHLRECFVVAKEGANKEQITESIVTMPNYFDEYDTTVHFIDAQTFNREHTSMPHGGQVIRRGASSEQANHCITFSLALESNPEFTAAVNVACARAVHRAYREGRRGCVTILDLPLTYWSAKEESMLYKELL